MDMHLLKWELEDNHACLQLNLIRIWPNDPQNSGSLIYSSFFPFIRVDDTVLVD